MKPVLRVVLIIIAIIILSLIANILSQLTGIPISVGDILFIPLSVFLMYFVIILFKDIKQNTKNENINSMTIKRRVLSSFIMLLIMSLCFFIMILGWREPFNFFDSVKGGAHGYTLILLGFSGFIFSCAGLLKIIFSLKKIDR